ncbi:hypothetical protein GCM10025787_45490 [Saccharopolyspora rosea]
MHAHQVAVPAHPDIAFQRVRSLFESQFVSTAGVLGAVGRRSPVRNDVGGRLPHAADYAGAGPRDPSDVTEPVRAVSGITRGAAS